MVYTLVRCVWFIELPFKFDISKDVSISEIIFDDISILPIKKKESKYFDSIKVEYKTNINDDLIPKDAYDSHKTIGFKDEVTKKIGFKVNRFVNAYCRQVEKHIINQIFNGDDFITHYQSFIADMDGKVLDGVLSANREVRVLDNNMFNSIIDDIKTQESNIVNEFMRLASCFLENGYFDMAVMNLSMALEAFIKKLVFSKGVTSQDLNEVKGYVEKFFHVGLKKAIGKSLKEDEPDYFEVVSFIHYVRNEIAHGGLLINLEEYKGQNHDDIYNEIDDLIDEVEDIFEWISR